MRGDIVEVYGRENPHTIDSMLSIGSAPETPYMNSRSPMFSAGTPLTLLAHDTPHVGRALRKTLAPVSTRGPPCSSAMSIRPLPQSARTTRQATIGQSRSRGSADTSPSSPYSRSHRCAPSLPSARRTPVQTLRTRVFLSASDDASARIASETCGSVMNTRLPTCPLRPRAGPSPRSCSAAPEGAAAPSTCRMRRATGGSAKRDGYEARRTSRSRDWQTMPPPRELSDRRIVQPIFGGIE